MGLFDRRDSADLLEDLLKREHKEILRGDFGALQRLLPDKERLVALTARAQPTGDRLLALKRQAARNHALLEAAAHGIRSVAQELGGLRTASPDLETYDSKGRRNPSRGNAGALERRV